MKFSVLIILLMVDACSFKKDLLENQTLKGHQELYSEPEKPDEVDNDYKRVIIASTNDVQGHYSDHEINFRDGHLLDKKQEIRIGGIDYISSYFKIMRQKYGHFLLLDSGNIFSKKPIEASYVQEFYALLDYDAMTIGLSDFNLRLPEKYHSSSEYFKEFSFKSKIPVILSNLYDLKTARIVEWPGTLPYLIKEVNGVKIGIMGLIPDDIVAKTPVDNRIGLYVENMLQSTLKQARLLRSLGAEIIIVMTHQSVTCGEDIAESMHLPLTKVNFEPQRSDICDLSSTLGQYLNRLPPHLIDLVISGRSNVKTANFINNTFVMSGFGEGRSLNYIEFFFDAKTKKLVREKTVIHQPVLFCHEFFKETNDCYHEDSSIDHRERVPAKFLGEEIKRDESLDHKFHHYLKGQHVGQTPISPESITEKMKHFESDLAYIDNSEGNAQLVTIMLTGVELARVLEEDFHHKNKNWLPNPFEVSGHKLSLLIDNEKLDNGKYYQILSDLESLQKHAVLKKYISNTYAKAIPTVSWNSQIMVDKVNTQLASPELNTVGQGPLTLNP